MDESKYETIYVEKYSTFEKTISFVKTPDSDLVKTVSKKDTLSHNVVQSFKTFFQEIFLPQGYPASVSSDYTKYQIWDTAQAFCSTITGTLSTHAVMKGVGVGDTAATPLAATITWVLKEGTGNIGRIIFAWWKGTSLDADSKKWRLVADILNDAAICLEVALPFFHGYTTYLLCLSTAMKSIVGVAGGATRAALTQHQAIRGNLADVAAKDGSQETAVNLIASFVAVFIISLVGENIWPVFFIFTSLHLFSNYKAVTSVCLNTFNSIRFINCFTNYLNTSQVLGPETVNKSETVTFLRNQMNDKTLCGFRIKIGSSIKKFLQSNKMDYRALKLAIAAFGNEKYFLAMSLEDRMIHIVLEESASSTVILLSYYHALLYGIIVTNDHENGLLQCKEDKTSITSLCQEHSIKHDTKNKIFSPSLEFGKDLNKTVTKTWEIFKQKAEIAGWRFDKNLLICDEWRGQWKHKYE